MRLTPSLYSQLVDLAARDCLIDVFGRRIAFCPIEEYPDFPNSLHSTGLVNIDGSAFVYFVDFAEGADFSNPDAAREIGEPLSRSRLQRYLDMKAENNAWWSNGREVDSLLLVVRAELSELEIADEVRELARQSGLVIWRLHLTDHDGRWLSLDPLGGYDWGEQRWAALVDGDDSYEPDDDYFYGSDDDDLYGPDDDYFYGSDDDDSILSGGGGGVFATSPTSAARGSAGGVAGPEIARLREYVAQYQGGAHSDSANERVDRWLTVFSPDERLPIVAELVHVLERSYLTREQATAGARAWLQSPTMASGGLIDAWEDATFLDVQAAGGSQLALMGILDEQATEMGLPALRDCCGQDAYVYVDDLSVHGTRILQDLKPWIDSHAPRDCDLLLLLQVGLTEPHDWVTRQLQACARGAGKTVRVHWRCDHDLHRADCYWPAMLPCDQQVDAYIRENGIDVSLRNDNTAGVYFSSVAGRRMLESALLTAGVQVIAANDRLRPRKYLRPLGNTIWSGLGMGVPIVTWRNCPNSAPLALWADGVVPALFPRQAN